MRNIIKYLTCLLLLVSVLSCAREQLPVSSDVEENVGSVTVHFGITLSDDHPATRAMAITPAIRYLKLAVFGSSGFLKQYVTATFESATTNGNSPVYNYSATLDVATGRRIVHIIGYGKENDNVEEEDPIPVLPFAYENEIFSTLTVSGRRDAYWQRIVLPNGIRIKTNGNGEPVDNSGNIISSNYVPTAETVQALSNIPLVRNFTQIAVNVSEDCDNFVLRSFVIVNKPSAGSIAPFSAAPAYSASRGFATSYLGKTLSELAAEGYGGFLPASAVLDDAVPTDSEVRSAGMNAKFMYERPVPVSNSGSSQSEPTFIIMYGTFTDSENASHDCFYKVYIRKDDENLPLLRNFKYELVIEHIARRGYNTVAEAYAGSGSGDVSSSADAENLTISDGTATISVTQSGWTFSNTTATTYSDIIGFRFEPLSDGNASLNVEITQTSVSSSGAVITTDFNNASEVAAMIPSTPSADGYYYLALNVNPASSSTREQVIRITGYYGSENQYKIFREVKLALISKQPMEVVCQPERIPSGVDQPIDVYVYLQPRMPDSIFPLQFLLHSSNLALTPTGGNNLAVSIANNTFYFNKTLMKSEYDLLPTDASGRPYMVTHFKTVKENSAGTISVYNVDEIFNDKYFIRASDSYTNYTLRFFRDLALDEVGGQARLRYNMSPLGAVTLQLTGMTPATGSPLVSNGDGTWTYTPTASAQTLYFDPDDDSEGIYIATLDAQDFQHERVSSLSLSGTLSTPPIGVGQRCTLRITYPVGHVYDIPISLSGLESDDPRLTDGAFTPDDENTRTYDIILKSTDFCGNVSVAVESNVYNSLSLSTTNRITTYELLPDSYLTLRNNPANQIDVLYERNGNYHTLGYFWISNMRNVFIDLMVFNDLSDIVYFRDSNGKMATCTIGTLINATSSSKVTLNFN